MISTSIQYATSGILKCHSVLQDTHLHRYETTPIFPSGTRLYIFHAYILLRMKKKASSKDDVSEIPDANAIFDMDTDLSDCSGHPWTLHCNARGTQSRSNFVKKRRYIYNKSQLSLSPVINPQLFTRILGLGHFYIKRVGSSACIRHLYLTDDITNEKPRARQREKPPTSHNTTCTLHNIHRYEKPTNRRADI